MINTENMSAIFHPEWIFPSLFTKNATDLIAQNSIVGHDNTILATSSHLSSVDLKTQSVGHAAIDLLAYAMNGSDTEPRRVMITPEFIDRHSAGHPRPS